VLALVLGTRGAARGEPVAEDFDFLHVSLFEKFSLLDGGGSNAFWRPVAHQLYYETLGPWILDHPRWVSWVHVLLMALAAFLLYRTFRGSFGGPAAFAIASFPALAESTRTLVCWPSHFVDLGAYLFLALALHERSRDRPWTAWPALLAALLCKELALVGAVLLPFFPGSRAKRPRAFWLAGTAALVAVWAVAYAWVRAHAGLELPHGLERDAALLATPLPARLFWALWNSLKATFSLSLTPSALDGLAFAGMAAIAVIAALRARTAKPRAFVLWGLAWCVLSWAALASIYPIWAPNRSQLGSVGLGIALVALLDAVHPLLPLALVALRVALFAAGPATPVGIPPEADARGAFMDYPRIARLENLMERARTRLREEVPRPAPGTMFGWQNLPLSTEYAFGGAHAVQAWYRDPTLRWVSYKEFRANPALPVRTVLAYQPPPHEAVVLLDHAALRAQLEGVAALEAGRWADAITLFTRADSLERDRKAAVFFGDNAGRRSYAWAQQRQWDRAKAEALTALAAAREDVGARLVLATVLTVENKRSQALAELDTLLARAPHDEEALALKAMLSAPPKAAGSPR
jgi:hypothetical protein